MDATEWLLLAAAIATIVGVIWTFVARSGRTKVTADRGGMAAGRSAHEPGDGPDGSRQARA